MLSSNTMIHDYPFAWIFLLFILLSTGIHELATCSNIVDEIRINSYTVKLNAEIEEATNVPLDTSQIFFEVDWNKSLYFNDSLLEARAYLMPSLYNASEIVEEAFLFSIRPETHRLQLFSRFTKDAFPSVRSNADLHLRRVFILVRCKSKNLQAQWSFNVRFVIQESWYTEELPSVAEARTAQRKMPTPQCFMLPIPADGLAQNTTIGFYRNVTYYLPDRVEPLLNTYSFLISNGYSHRVSIGPKPSTLVRSFSVSDTKYDPDIVYTEKKCAAGDFPLHSGGFIEIGIHSTSFDDQYRCDGTLNFMEVPHNDLDFICYNEGCRRVHATFTNYSFPNEKYSSIVGSSVKAAVTCLFQDSRVVKWCLEGKLISENKSDTFLEQKILGNNLEKFDNLIGLEAGLIATTICLVGVGLGPRGKLCLHQRATRVNRYKWDWIYFSRPPWYAPFQEMEEGEGLKKIPGKSYFERTCEKIAHLRHSRTLPDDLSMAYKMCQGELDLLQKIDADVEKLEDSDDLKAKNSIYE